MDMSLCRFRCGDGEKFTSVSSVVNLLAGSEAVPGSLGCTPVGAPRGRWGACIPSGDASQWGK